MKQGVVYIGTPRFSQLISFVADLPLVTNLMNVLILNLTIVFFNLDS